MTDTLIERVSRWLAWAAGAVILFGCALPITVDVLSRYFLNRSAVESFEISGFGLAACIGLGMAHTVTTKAHIRVDFAVARLPFPLRAACDLLAACVLAVVAGAQRPGEGPPQHRTAARLSFFKTRKLVFPW